MAPPAVFALPFFQFYSSINLFDTHIAVALSHCLFNIPLAVWILEGFISAVPKELDEKVASLHLEKLGVKITKLSDEQAKYIGVNKNGPFKKDNYRY